LKRHIVLALLLSDTPSIATEDESYCEFIEQMAHASMLARLSGVPMQSMLSLVKDETAGGIVRAAYKYPVHREQNEKQSPVKEFSSAVRSQCLQQYQ
jgi:hypothetical protein